MSEQQARERAAELANGYSQGLKGAYREVLNQTYYDGYMAAWRDAQ